MSSGATYFKYRDIPVPTINIEILMKKCGKMPRDYEIKELMQGIVNENLHKLSEADYEAKVRKYITEKTPVWKDIVKKIEIQYPFDDEDLKGIEIVDTPGVNADGRVGEITHEYIAKANAVMFLKPIVGSALEATSFKKFLEGNSADRNRDAMFLILTRSANETPGNVARVRDAAFLQFPGINEHQIIHVDSKVEMFYNRVKDMSDMFSICANLSEIDVRNWNTSRVTSMRSMFNRCESISSLDLSRWDLSNVNDFSFMFQSCENLETLKMNMNMAAGSARKQCMFNLCKKVAIVVPSID